MKPVNKVVVREPELDAYTLRMQIFRGNLWGFDLDPGSRLSIDRYGDEVFMCTELSLLGSTDRCAEDLYPGAA